MADPANAANAVPVVDGAVSTQAADEQPGHKVFTGNLAYTTTDEGLKAFFSPVADDVISAQVIFRGTRSAGYGFAAFKSAEAAQKAVELLNKKELDGRTLIVEVAKPTEEKQKEKKEKRAPKKRSSKKSKADDGTNGTADATTESKDTAAKSETTGDAKPKKKRNTRKAKKAKGEAKEGEAADTATTGGAAAPAAPAEPKPKKVKTPKAKPAKPVRPIGEAPEGEPSKTMLFVANLGFTVDDDALSELFTSAGIQVTSARVVRRRWGQPRRSKGYGFVDVGSEEEQKKALELLQGKEVGGREIAVKIAVNTQEHEAADGQAPAHNVPSLVAAAS
ncbi:hypothetical protein M408DRAFT_326132 [Serendipita vermifera MAFF 305830]|uniref:RRM domain-containing protein n=1 Tax=Serendipita vermifera MAFF 305830 TaxID=933852 RepID=A0A0C2X5K4_SERVB|nr:hypothetical protein M408DRAFT_326132 [Serendipita vermifera MAFF 305830]